MANTFLEVKNLSVCYGEKKKFFTAVSHVNFHINQGETFGLVGESGSGKTTIGRSIMRIVPSTGDILYQGKKINQPMSKQEDKTLTRSIQMIFQDPMASLNERAKIDYIIAEGLYHLHPKMKKEARLAIVKKAMEEVGLLPDFLNRFPHEFSGGQRQRIGIARALVMEPKLIIADEPISALDVSIRAQVLNLLMKLQAEKKLTYLFISHDLSVMAYICDRIGVLYQGKLVELAETKDLFKNPLHPYTKSLLSAIPNPDPKTEKNKTPFFYDSSIHQYDDDHPYWEEITPGHFIRANLIEMKSYRESMYQNHY